MDTNIDIDPALVAEFIDESLDFLAEVDNLFVQLEESPADIELIQSIFRPIHSIKGNSSFFGFVKVKNLSHEMETLLDLVRKGALSVSPELISLLLEGVDELKQILSRCRMGSAEVEDEDLFEELVTRTKAHAQGDSLDLGAACASLLEALTSLRGDLAPLGAEARGKLDKVIQRVKEMAPKDTPAERQEKRRPWPEPMRVIVRTLDAPIEGVLSDEDAEGIRDQIVALGACTDNAEVQAELNELVETVDMFAASVGFDELLQETILEKLSELDDLDAWLVDEPKTEADAGAAPEPAAEAAPAVAQSTALAEKTMRVSEAQIDTFLSYVGELLVVGDMFNHLQQNISKQNGNWKFVTDFKLANNTFTELSDDLQDSIMAIRKISVGSLLQKVPRIIRDIATHTGKKIKVEITGEDVLVDKSLMDLLDAPLTHMVRNAGDHGVEMPDVREGKGKNAEGLILVSVEEEGSTITLTVQDDGAGLDYDAIQKKAESLGLTEPGKTLTEDEVVNFLFASGVSTAKEITDVSGRGVGMDVVKRMIEEAGGTISVESAADKGSTFRLSLPKSVTTQIMQGFLVESNGQAFVLPMNKVHEASQIESGTVTDIPGLGSCFTYNDRIMPIISLRSTLGLPARNGSVKEERIAITVAAREGLFAMGVDAVLGVQKIVFREINGLSMSTETISGGALMGDGSVALILDVDRLMRESSLSNGAKA